MCDLVPLLPSFLTLCRYFACSIFAPASSLFPRMQKERIVYITVWHTFCCNVLPYAKAVPKGGWGCNLFYI